MSSEFLLKGSRDDSTFESLETHNPEPIIQDRLHDRGVYFPEYII